MALTLKGTSQGLVLKPESDSWDEVILALENSLQESGKFFRGGRMILDVDPHGLPEPVLLNLRTVCERHNLELWAILSEDEEVKRLTRSYGLLTRLPSRLPLPEVAAPVAATPEIPVEDQGNALLIEGTIRSGRRVQHSGHIVLVGDVNPGAEISAGGNIIVWGRVRGIVHAGAAGNAHAVICALELTPLQLRIAGHISRSPEEKPRRARPEMAKVQNGIIVVEPWMG